MFLYFKFTEEESFRENIDTNVINTVMENNSQVNVISSFKILS